VESVFKSDMKKKKEDEKEEDFGDDACGG